MKIVSGFTKGILSKMISFAIKKKSGCEVDIQLKDFKASVIDGKSHVHLELDASLEKDELVKLLKTYGLS